MGKLLNRKSFIFISAIVIALIAVALFTFTSCIGGGVSISVDGGNGGDGDGDGGNGGDGDGGNGDGTPSAGPVINSVTADDPDDVDSTYGDGDTITFVFSENTNEPFGPNPTQADLDTLFGAMNLGTTYSGTWSNASTLVITITDDTGGTAPVIDTTTFTLQVAGGLKNAANTSEVSTDTSPAISGDWGLLVVLSVSNAAATSSTTVMVTFDSNVEQTTAETGGNYSISGLTVSGAIRDGVDFTIVVLTTSTQEDINYTLTVTGVTDTDSNGLGAQNSKTFGGDVAPYIDSVSSYSNTEVVVYFSEAVDETLAETVGNYSIPDLTVSSATRDASDFSRVSLVTLSQAGGTNNYTLTISNVTDLTVNALASPNSRDFSGTGVTDTTKPTVLSAALVDSDTVSVQFSEPVDSSTSQIAGNYTIKDNADQDVTVNTATQQSDTTKVWLDISGTFSEILYTLTVSTTVKDVALIGNTLEDAPNNTVSFAGEGTIPEDLGDGAVIVNPVEPATATGTFSLFTEYKGRIYIGPSDEDDQVFRIKPDGSDPELVTFYFHGLDDLLAPTTTTTLDPGPNGEDGIDFIAGGTVGGTAPGEYLFIGPSNSDGDLDYIYYTTESGSTLNFYYMDLSLYLGGNTKGVSAMVVFNEKLYIGYPDKGAKRPYLMKIVNVTQSPGAGDVVNLKADEMPRVGKNGTPANGAAWVGIDSLVGYHNGTFNGLYFGNGGSEAVDEDGGVLRSTNDNPTDYATSSSDWGDITPTAQASWNNTATRFSKMLTGPNKLIPSDKAFPAMAVFNGKLYAIRNTTNASGGPQLWKYNGPSSTWSLVADNGSGITDMSDSDNSEFTMLVVNGNMLYIGYDNSTDGVQVWRTKSGVTDPSAVSDFEMVSTAGLGDATNNQKIYGGISVASGGTDYIWLLVGKEGGNLAVFRTSN